MASSLTSTTLTINETQPITGIKTTLNNSSSEVPTSAAVKSFIDPLVEPVLLSLVGNWANPQYASQSVDTTGLIFIVTYGSGKTASVTPGVSPSTWSSTVGTQTATFSYTENGITVTATKTASVVGPWSPVAITLTNPNSGLAFRSISGNLYTNSACTTRAATNTKYTGTTFYYKSNETKPTGSYIYNYGDGASSSSEPSKDTIQTYYNEGSLTACLGTSGYCWAGVVYSSLSIKIDLSSGSWGTGLVSDSNHRVRSSTF